MVGKRESAHTVGHGRIHEFLDGCLAVEQAVLRMDVKMSESEIGHLCYFMQV